MSPVALTEPPAGSSRGLGTVPEPSRETPELRDPREPRAPRDPREPSSETRGPGRPGGFSEERLEDRSEDREGVSLPRRRTSRWTSAAGSPNRARTLATAAGSSIPARSASIRLRSTATKSIRCLGGSTPWAASAALLT